jgi:hypothetical protein
MYDIALQEETVVNAEDEEVEEVDKGRW